MQGTQAGTSRRGKKKYGSLSLYIIHKGTHSFCKYFCTCCFTRFFADFSPAATELRQAVRCRGKQYLDPACTGSVTLSTTVTHASPKQVLRGPTAVCFVEWEGGLPLLPRFLLVALTSSPLFPLDPRQLLSVCVSVCVCVCNLLFRCRWLVPGCWLFNLGFWRNQILDLLCTDGYFIWLEPPLEMFQGALIRIKSIHKEL